MSDRTVVVLGGGTGGLVAARRLRRQLDPADRVVLIDRSPAYQFAPSFLWVMTGARRPEQVSADRRPLRRGGIEVLQAEILEIDPDRRRVRTPEADVAFDRLVIALGADLAPDALAGFTQAAHNVYTLDGASAAAGALHRFDAGRVAVLVSSLPYKCPAAPYETAFLAEALLRRRKVRDRTSVAIYTPEPSPMPTAGPVLGQALTAMLADRGIGFHPDHAVESVDADAGELVFAGGERAGFDLLLGVPAHRAPAVLATSGLAAGTGFLPVDRTTLATPAEGVFAIGDATTIPVAGGKFLPKAGVFAEAQAKVVAANLAAELAGRVPRATFDGAGACFVELGDQRAAFAAGHFYAPDAPVGLSAGISCRPPKQPYTTGGSSRSGATTPLISNSPPLTGPSAPSAAGTSWTWDAGLGGSLPPWSSAPGQSPERTSTPPCWPSGPAVVSPSACSTRSARRDWPDIGACGAHRGKRPVSSAGGS